MHDSGPTILVNKLAKANNLDDAISEEVRVMMPYDDNDFDPIHSYNVDVDVDMDVDVDVDVDIDVVSEDVVEVTVQ